MNIKIDKFLLLGGVLFGVGWGLVGICFGFVMVFFVVMLSVENLMWIVFFIAGMWAYERVVG